MQSFPSSESTNWFKNILRKENVFVRNINVFKYSSSFPKKQIIQYLCFIYVWFKCYRRTCIHFTNIENVGINSYWICVSQGWGHGTHLSLILRVQIFKMCQKKLSLGKVFGCPDWVAKGKGNKRVSRKWVWGGQGGTRKCRKQKQPNKKQPALQNTYTTQPFLMPRELTLFPMDTRVCC